MKNIAVFSRFFSKWCHRVKKNAFISNKQLNGNTGILSKTQKFSNLSNKLRYSSKEIKAQQFFLSELLNSKERIQRVVVETEIPTQKDFTDLHSRIVGI